MTTEERVRSHFARDTATHELRIIRDEGLYRHLRMRRADRSSFYHYDLVTWPGYLAIVGDAGDYVFSRVTDMFTFFESDRGRINPHYWAQKLQGRDVGRSGARSYTHEAFVAQVHEWVRQEVDSAEWEGTPIYESLLREAADRELGVRSWTHHEEEARERLRDVEFDVGEQVFGDAWEWDLRDYDHQFIWCCWAIVLGIKHYRAATRRDYHDRGDAA